MRQKVLRSKINFVFVIVFLGFLSCVQEGDCVVIISPIYEDCDEFKLIWNIDSVVIGNSELKNKSIYLLNSKKTHGDTIKECVTKGVFRHKIIKEHYTECGDVFEFLDLPTGPSSLEYER